jgi:nucleotide-binding universal stress UspA family protein
VLYDQIIVPFDGTKEAGAASQIGADLSALFGAPLLVLTSARTDQSGDLAVLKERAMSLSTDAVEVWVESERTPGRAVASVAQHRGSNALVVMASHARTGVRRAMFGSVAEDVVRAADTPVLVLGPRCFLRDPVDLRQVVVCVDATATAEAVLPLAATWADALGLRCLLVHVRTSEKQAGSFDFEPLVGTLRGVCDDIDAQVVDADDVADGIQRVVGATAASVVAMATHGRHGLDRFAHGSVTADVVRASTVPVLVQRGSVIPDVEWLRRSAAAD